MYKEMKTFNIQAAKTHLSRLIDEVVAGEEITIAKAGKPLVRLIPYKAPGTVRRGGQFAAEIWEAPDCWSDESELAESIASPLYTLEEHQSTRLKAAERSSDE